MKPIAIETWRICPEVLNGTNLEEIQEIAAGSDHGRYRPMWHTRPVPWHFRDSRGRVQSSAHGVDIREDQPLAIAAATVRAWRQYILETAIEWRSTQLQDAIAAASAPPRQASLFDPPQAEPETPPVPSLAAIVRSLFTCGQCGRAFGKRDLMPCPQCGKPACRWTGTGPYDLVCQRCQPPRPALSRNGLEKRTRFITS